MDRTRRRAWQQQLQRQQPATQPHGAVIDVAVRVTAGSMKVQVKAKPLTMADPPPLHAEEMETVLYASSCAAVASGRMDL